mgnify:CR=1 FL=1
MRKNIKSNRNIMVKRIKHNDLIPWFTMDHDQLPASYLKSTQKFFDGLQATSDKRQARVGPPHNVQGHKEKK